MVRRHPDHSTGSLINTGPAMQITDLFNAQQRDADQSTPGEKVYTGRSSILLTGEDI